MVVADCRYSAGAGPVEEAGVRALQNVQDAQAVATVEPARRTCRMGRTDAMAPKPGTEPKSGLHTDMGEVAVGAPCYCFLSHAHLQHNVPVSHLCPPTAQQHALNVSINFSFQPIEFCLCGSCLMSSASTQEPEHCTGLHTPRAWCRGGMLLCKMNDNYAKSSEAQHSDHMGRSLRLQYGW